MEPLRLQVAAVPASVPHLRRSLAAWLNSICGASALCDTGYDLMLAVNEAATNCVDHAYRGRPAGSIAVNAGLQLGPSRIGLAVRPCADRLVTLEIADFGRWCPPSEEPGHRGHGLSMIEALVARFDLTHPSPGLGTVVTLQQPLGRC